MAGGITDLQVDYREYITAAYGDQHLPLRDIDWLEVRSATLTQRALFNFFRDISNEARATPTLVDAQFNSWLAKRGVTSVRNNWWLLSERQIQFLVALLEGIQLPGKLDLSRPAVAIPYWGNHHSLCAIQWLGSGDEDYGMTKVRPFRHSWAGLWGRGAAFKESSLPAAQAGQMTLHFQPTTNYICRSVVSPVYTPVTQPLKDWNIRGIGDLAKHVELSTHCDNVDLPWGEFVTGQVLKAVGDNVPVRDINTFVNNAELTLEQRGQIAQRLELSGRPGVATSIQENCLSTVVHLDDKWKLVAGPFDYRAGRPNGALEPLTNFAWTPDSLLLFDDTPPWIAGNFQSRDLQKQVRVQGKDLDSPNAFEDAIRKELPTEIVPMIYDKKSFQPLLTIWRKKVDYLPRRLGLGYLGWSHDRKKFQLPGIVITGEEVRVVSNPVWNPQSIPLHDYTAMPLPRGEAPAVSDNDKVILSALAGGIARAFRKVSPIPISLPESLRPVLERLFQKLGQPFPLNIAQNNRGQTKDVIFNGFPTLLNTAPISLLDAMRWTSWMIGGDGASDFLAFYNPEPVTPTLLEAAAHLVVELPQKLMQKGNGPHHRSVDPVLSLLSEGAFHTGAVITPRYPKLDALFGSISLEDHREVSGLNYTNHEIGITSDLVNDALVLEASLLCGSPVKRDGQLLILPEIPAVRMLKNFYDLLPKMPVTA